MAQIVLSELNIRRLIERRGIETGVYFYVPQRDVAGLQARSPGAVSWQAFELPWNFNGMTVGLFDRTFVDEVEDAIYPDRKVERSRKSFSHWGMIAA